MLGETSITLVILLLLGIGIYDYLKLFDENECTITWMYQAPKLLPVPMPIDNKKPFERYKLFLYCEGYECDTYEKLRFNTGNIPVLFVPGNADSAKQVRSLGSIAIDKSRHSKSKSKIKFQFFTISFNEEFSALHGPFLQHQTEYVKYCVEHILQLFHKSIKDENKRPNSVVLIGNSLGGLISRGIFVPNVLKNETKQIPVHTIITKSTPHRRPVVNIDTDLNAYYSEVNRFWLNKKEARLDDVVLASLYGGYRDILVRSNLANINEWQSLTSASIISSYTKSMPNVWKSIDHKCMAWCRELILQINRALFSLVDPTTQQIISDRKKRLHILRKHFIRDDYLDNESISAESLSKTDLIHTSQESQLNRLNNKKQMLAYEFNDYNDDKKMKLILFDLQTLFASTSSASSTSRIESSIDSLFVYTNNNQIKSLVLCKEFLESSSGDDDNKQYTCKSYKDLMNEHGRPLGPPVSEQTKRENKNIKLLNIVDFRSQYASTYGYLMIRVPAKWMNRHENHQLVVKFDWYAKNERIKSIEMPNTFEFKKEIIISSNGLSTKNFRRFYIDSFSNILQVYYFVKSVSSSSTSSSSCDQMLHDELAKYTNETRKRDLNEFNIDSSKLLPVLASSTLFAIFYDPVSSTQIENMNEHFYSTESQLTHSKPLILRLNNNLNNLTSYIDLIQFDVRHLLNKNMLSSSELNEEKCNKDFKLTFNFSINGSLGQLIRFYATFIPTFCVFILQASDLISLTQAPSFSLSQHFVSSLLLSFLIYFARSFRFDWFTLFNNDYTLLDSIERISNIYIPFLLYWISYALINLITAFLEVKLFFHKKILHSFCFFFNKIPSYFFLIALISFFSISIFLASTLAISVLLFSEIFHVASKITADEIRKRRILFIFLILTFNLPSLVSWLKIMELKGFGRLSESISDYSLYQAILCIILQLIAYSKLKPNLIGAKLQVVLIGLNSLLTILFSSTSLYRVPYFIIIHLFLLCLNSTITKNLLADKKTKND